MLNDIKVLNGTLEYPFNIYTYEYTVLIDDSTTSLEFEFIKDDSIYIEVTNNNIDDYNKDVLVHLYYNDNVDTYTFHTYTDNSDEVIKIDESLYKIEVEDYKDSLCNVELLCIGVFLLIVFFFSLIFGKKRRHIKKY